MNRREELQDRYEDALFALLMDEIAAMEGEMAWEENERLKNDPSAAIPEDVDKRCLQTIRRHFAKQKAQTAGRFTVKAAKYVIMAAGLAALLFTGAFAASETVRVNTMNLIVEMIGESTDFYIPRVSTFHAIPQLSVGWIPDGYVLQDQGYDNTKVWYQYQKSDDEYIRIKLTLSDGTLLSLDTEDAETEYVEITGIEAMLIQKDDIQQLMWLAENDTVFIQIISQGTSQEEILYVANKLKY